MPQNQSRHGGIVHVYQPSASLPYWRYVARETEESGGIFDDYIHDKRSGATDGKPTLTNDEAIAIVSSIMPHASAIIVLAPWSRATGYKSPEVMRVTKATEEQAETAPAAQCSFCANDARYTTRNGVARCQCCNIGDCGHREMRQSPEYQRFLSALGGQS